MSAIDELRKRNDLDAVEMCINLAAIKLNNIPHISQLAAEEYASLLAALEEAERALRPIHEQIMRRFDHQEFTYIDITQQDAKSIVDALTSIAKVKP